MKNRRIHSNEFKTGIVEKIQAGTPINELAQQHKLNRSMVLRWIKEAGGVKTPHRAPPKRKTHVTTLTTQQKRDAVAELQAGGNAEDIAKRFGVTTSGLYYWRKTIGKLNGKADGSAVVTVNGTGNGHDRIPHIAAQHAMRDATVLLRKAKSELMRGIKLGTIDDLDPAHLLSLLALQSLQGE